MLTFLYALHFLVCFILIFVVLLQRGKGQDLGASLGGGSANTIFGSRGAGNFLTKITTASAIVFMGTSLSLSYLGYKSSDVRLFDESEPFLPEGAAPKAEPSGLEEVPAAAGAPPAPAPADTRGGGGPGGHPRAADAAAPTPPPAEAPTPATAPAHAPAPRSTPPPPKGAASPRHNISPATPQAPTNSNAAPAIAPS